MAKESQLEKEFRFQLMAYDIPFEQEVKLIPGRKFHFDFFIPTTNIAIEIQGGVWSKLKMGHNSGSGIKRDCEKSNLAQKYGYILFKFTSDMVRNGEAILFLNNVLNDDDDLPSK